MIALRILAITLAVGEGVAVASHCHEVSPVLGHSHCSSFGSRWSHWDGGAAMAGVGLVLDHIPVRGFDLTGTVASTTATASYHTLLAPGPHRMMWALGPRFTFGARWLHVIAAVEITALIALDGPTSMTQVAGFPAMTTTYAGGGDIAAVLGVHEALAGFDVGALLAIGGRSIGFPQSLPDGFTTCNGQSGKDCGVLPEQDDLIVEPRIYVGAWIDPKLSLDVSAGLDVATGGESFAVTVTLHGAPYDGR